jgi:hypothetical protein
MNNYVYRQDARVARKKDFEFKDSYPGVPGVLAVQNHIHFVIGSSLGYH